MPRVGFQPMIPIVEREKTFHALDSAATVISFQCSCEWTTVRREVRQLLWLHCKMYYPSCLITQDYESCVIDGKIHMRYIYRIFKIVSG
jgi:hypothetical protein